jgi:hypothetical protein
MCADVITLIGSRLTPEIPISDFLPVSGPRAQILEGLLVALQADRSLTAGFTDEHWEVITVAAIDRINQCQLLTDVIAEAPGIDSEQLATARQSVLAAMQELMKAAHPHYNRRAVRDRRAAEQRP